MLRQSVGQRSWDGSPTWPFVLLLTLLSLFNSSAISAAEPPFPSQLEFFETRIRPVLVDQCYECHNSTKSTEGGLAVDARAALLEGGDGGPIIVAGKPADSRLLAILRHEVKGIKMPQGSAKLDERVIADFEKWIAMGAPDPRDKPPSAEELARATSWEEVLKKRKQWWSFQPIRALPAPDVPNNNWSQNPIDRFVLAKLREHDLEPGEPADPGTLVRRLYFALVGLPPNADEVTLWTERLRQPRGFDDLVDHLLGSPQFGERWARHWMDWIRYAESHGSEGDPNIENAWRYRDYLIRALNQNIPYDQLLREHFAGDLLEQPRINKDLGINESRIGTAHWRMVFHGFAPTDALDEKVRFIDDEVNTFSKAFLGLTVSCARCHDHKFDPISQRDYYALFGILSSCRPGRIAIDTQDVLDANRDQLASLKPQIRSAIGDAWLKSATQLHESLLDNQGPWKAADKPTQIFNPWFVLRKETNDGAPFAAAWQRQVDAWQADRRQRDEHAQRKYRQRWDLTDPAVYATWFRYGNGLPSQPSAAGEFAISPAGESALSAVFPSGIYTNTLSAKHVARLSSGDLRLDDNYDLWLRVIGEGSSARYVVEDYPRDGTVFPVKKLSNDWKWEKLDLTYWNGDQMHVELSAGKDAPLMVNNEARSWFGIREAVLVKKGEPGPPAEPREFLDPLFQSVTDSPPRSFDELADQYAKILTAAIKSWQANTATDAQAGLLAACLKQGVLPNQLDQLPTAKPLITEYRRLEEAIVVPTRVPGLEESLGREQHLFERGNHKLPKDIVPRRFLEAIDATPYADQTHQSGRLQLAEDILRDKNPLTRRVIVNRLWHHLFGRGLVATPDNFGRLGQPPTHPELLDYLATQFKEQDWSIKDAIRAMVTSKTWQTTSRPSAKALQVDPANQYLSHSHVRRLEAEAIRDSLLAVSGTLSRDLFGGPADGNSNRRSVYVRVTRNSLDPFLRSFDFPEPFSATGRRDVTNVPAQSLTLLNDDRVAALAADWAARVIANPKIPQDDERIQSMFLTAFGRPASTADVEQMKSYLAETKAGYLKLTSQVAELRQQIEQRQAAVRTLIQPVRTRLIEQAKSKSATGEQVVPQPIGRWEFEGDLKDVIGTAHGEARGGAKIDSGMLVVNQQSHVITAPLKQTLKAKTLEAWVQLDTLDQVGGGVMTIQTPDGVTFDAIVFAEQSPRQWLAGSNGFVRTQSFNAPQDQDVAQRAVHLAIAYHDDGRIIGYRDGQPYGKPYKSNGPSVFKAGETVIGFGIRHLPAGGNRMLSGRILRAQIYDRALTADEIQATSQSAPYFVSEAQVLAALTEAERQQIASDRQKVRDLEAEIAALGIIPEAVNDQALWTELARALFTFKEFIYVR